MKFFSTAAISILASGAIASPVQGQNFGNGHPPGVPYAEGQRFMLDGKPFLFAGTNAYWLPFINSPPDVKNALTQAKNAGLKVVRTWAFNEKNHTFISGGLPQYGGEGAGVSPVYFQSWQNGTATINYGATGLQVLDQVVNTAEQLGLKLIMTLTNNWADYGGMDVYTVNLGGQYHDEFYTNPKVIAAFKKYVSVLVDRYKHSTAIFAWELANEPRCGADSTRNLPRSPSGCSYVQMDKWMAELGSFVKSIDNTHMVTWGGEGEFYEEGNTDWAYAGADGGNFYAELKLPEMDFGTFHLYPDWWSKTVGWANKWVSDHGDAQRSVNKPVLFEEYGWLNPADRLAWLGRTVPANETRVSVISEWQSISLDYRMSDMYWQLGVCGLTFGCSTDDGFTIFLNNKTESEPLVYQHAAKVNEVNSCLK